MTANQLHITRVGAKSAVTGISATSPLALLNPNNHGDGAWVYQSSHGGGWVGLDEVGLDVTVGAGASLFLSTQASGKAYRGANSSFHLRARVERGATLVCWPEPTTCFAGAALRQQQHFELEEGASLLFVDTLTSGRAARGEHWAFSRFESEVRITIAGREVMHDAVLLSPDHGPLIPRMACDATAVVVCIGPALRGALDTQRGASVWPWGTVWRRTSDSVALWQNELRAALQGPVSSALGDDPCARRF